MLLYRLPGQEIQYLKGNFERIPMDAELEGFIVSSADGKQRFVFKEGLNSHSIENLPIDFTPEVINQSHFIDSILKLKQAIKQAGLVKVVLSRIVKRNLASTSLENLFERMCKTYPQAFVYCFVDTQLGIWIGASPEILLRRIDHHFFLMSLAGTKSISETREWTEKEKHEQHLVTDFILDCLNSQSVESQEIQGPYEHEAGPVQHLRTDISFTGDPSLERILIDHLHPTPAVCGLPREMAVEAISLLESHQRELYSGFIGIFEKKQTHCYVNLRCGKVINNELFAFVGAGITSESNEQDEWLETENKSKTIIDLLEIN